MLKLHRVHNSHFNEHFIIVHDATAKMNSGLLSGNVNHFGNYFIILITSALNNTIYP